MKKTVYQFDQGADYTATKGVNIGNSTYTMDQVRRCGIESLIGRATDCPAADLGAGLRAYSGACE